MPSTSPISTSPARRIRVLCVEDSALYCRVLAEMFEPFADIELVGFAADPYIARDRLRTCEVDVLTLDLEMPRMPGLTFLKLLMEHKPMPVVVLSSQTQTGSQRAIEALFAGAISVLGKPETHARRAGFAERLAHDIRVAAQEHPRRLRPRPSEAPNPTSSPAPRPPWFDARQIVALGASTGGAQALERVFSGFPASMPGIVVVQHIPAGFCADLAARLDAAGPIRVRVAREGDLIEPGHALLAPGGSHLEVRRAGHQYRAHLQHGAPVEHQRPSIDVLFQSLAASAGSHAVAVLLTGMGCDGAAGMKRLSDTGATTLAQDAASSAVFGMAREAVRLEAVHAVVPLDHLAHRIVQALHPRQTATPT